jgi:hypothetical protein
MADKYDNANYLECEARRKACEEAFIAAEQAHAEMAGKHHGLQKAANAATIAGDHATSRRYQEQADAMWCSPESAAVRLTLNVTAKSYRAALRAEGDATSFEVQQDVFEYRLRAAQKMGAAVGHDDTNPSSH